MYFFIYRPGFTAQVSEPPAYFLITVYSIYRYIFVVTEKQYAEFEK